MNEKKIVTWEAFKKWHEHLVGYIEDGDGLEVDIENTEADIEEGVEDENY